MVFAVCYPTGVTEDNLADATLTWTVRVKSGEPSAEWSEGGLAQLAQAVLQAPRSLSGADVAAQWLSNGLDEAVQRLKTPVRRALAQALDLPATKLQGGERSDGYFVAAKRGMLVVATAMLFHHRVQQFLPAECPEDYDGEWPPASATDCAEQDAVISAFREAWRGILAVDYRPVFETGRTALDELTIDLDTSQAVRSLAAVVARVSERVHGLRHDLLGRIFHKVLDTARYDGSFYTSTAAAVLLASLALREKDGDWSDPNFHSLSPHLRPRLRHRNAADGRGRAHSRPAQRRWATRSTGRRVSRSFPGGRCAVGLRREFVRDTHGRQHAGNAGAKDQLWPHEHPPDASGRVRRLSLPRLLGLPLR